MLSYFGLGPKTVTFFCQNWFLVTFLAWDVNFLAKGRVKEWTFEIVFFLTFSRFTLKLGGNDLVIIGEAGTQLSQLICHLWTKRGLSEIQVPNMNSLKEANLSNHHFVVSFKVLLTTSQSTSKVVKNVHLWYFGHSVVHIQPHSLPVECQKELKPQN